MAASVCFSHQTHLNCSQENGEGVLKLPTSNTRDYSEWVVSLSVRTIAFLTSSGHFFAAAQHRCTEVICHTLQAQFGPMEWDGMQEHLGCSMSKSWVVDFVGPCIFVVNVGDIVWNTVIWVLFCRSCHISSITIIHFVIKSFHINTVCLEAPCLNDVACIWQHPCAFISLSYNSEHCTPSNPLCSANSVTVQRVLSSVHWSVMVSDMSLWKDTEHPLHCMLAVDTLPTLHAITHLVSVWHIRVW